MAKKIFYLDSKHGRKTNSGLYPGEPKHPDEFQSLPVEPGDAIAFRAAQTHIGQFEHSRSGTDGKPVTLTTFWVGGERTRWARLSNPDTTAARPVSLDVNASYIDLDHLEAADARYAGFLFRETQGHINGVNLRARDTGIGARLRGSFIRLTHPDFQNMKPSRNQGKVTDEGGVAFSFESTGYVNTDNVLDRPLVINARTELTNGSDGGDVEGFGDVTRASILGGTFIGGKGFGEFGGPTPKDNGGRVSVMKDWLIERNLIINNGVTLMFNDPLSDFPIVIKNMIFNRNTVYDRLRDRSAVYFKGNWSDLSEALTLTNNVYSGIGGWIGSNGKTNLESVKHSGNLLHRVNGGDLGHALGKDDLSGEPLFANAAGFDFRLKAKLATGGLPGALDLWQAYASVLDLKWILKQSRLPFTANDLKGGLHTYLYPWQMWGIPPELRAAGMECALSAYDLLGQLDADMNTWWVE